MKRFTKLSLFSLFFLIVSVFGGTIFARGKLIGPKVEVFELISLPQEGAQCGVYACVNVKEMKHWDVKKIPAKNQKLINRGLKSKKEVISRIVKRLESSQRSRHNGTANWLNQYEISEMFVKDDDVVESIDELKGFKVTGLIDADDDFYDEANKPMCFKIKSNLYRDGLYLTIVPIAIRSEIPLHCKKAFENPRKPSLFLFVNAKHWLSVMAVVVDGKLNIAYANSLSGFGDPEFVFRKIAEKYGFETYGEEEGEGDDDFFKIEKQDSDEEEGEGADDFFEKEDSEDDSDDDDFFNVNNNVVKRKRRR